jgi:hypothetical protein
MDLAGYQGGAVRAPLQGPDELQRTEIGKLLSDVNRTMVEIKNAKTA